MNNSKMKNKAHIKIDKIVEYCSDCPFCHIECIDCNETKSGCFEYNLGCELFYEVPLKQIYFNLQYFEVFSMTDSTNLAKDFVPDSCLNRIFK